MNAAFLLLTACVAGADTAPANVVPVKPVPAPVYSVGTAGCTGCGGCGTCDSCGCESEGFLSKLKARLHHHNDCDCGCSGGCESEGFLSKLKGKLHHNECGCETGCAGCGSACDTCGGHGSGLGEKLRGLFHKHNECGCDTGCGGCGSVITSTPIGTMKPEPIGGPKKGDELKKLPSDDKKNPEKNPEKKPNGVRLIPQPVDVPDLDITPTTGKSPF